MKVVRTKEDIQGNMWCRATAENYNALLQLGFTYRRKWYSILNDYEYHCSDIFLLQDNDNSVKWCSWEAADGEEITFNLTTSSVLLDSVFMQPKSFNVEILKIFGAGNDIEYIGTINNNVPAKWNAEGVCLNLSSEYNLYKEYKQRIYTKINTKEFYPKQKFTVSNTEKMSTSFEKQGWRLATNEEIEEFKI